LTQISLPTIHYIHLRKQVSLSKQKRQNISWNLTVEMNVSMTTQEPVEQAKAKEDVRQTKLIMVEIPFCPTLPMIEVPLFVQV
jgi:hypothetical protein